MKTLAVSLVLVGVAAAADGKSAPTDSTQAKERISARNDLGAVEIEGIGEIKGEASDARKLIKRSCLMANFELHLPFLG